MTDDAYPLWHDATAYRNTLVVAQHHPQASDDNAGTDAAPLYSIQSALERVQPGQRIRIHAGIYRESLAPIRGGTAADRMIALESAPGERVVVRGSQPLCGTWSQPRPWEAGFGHGEAIPVMSQRVWQARLDERLFEPGANPFAHPNVDDWEARLMPWMEPVSGRAPFTLRRGLLFQDGQRLTQLHHYGDVPRVPGSFWVAEDGLSLHVHPLDGKHPDQASFEVTAQSHLLCPTAIGLEFIRVSGIVFEHCGNSFLRAGAGAVTTRGGGHWIIEDCTFRQINSAGLEFGDHPFERDDPHPLNPSRTWRGSGHTIVRRNRFHHCGTAGMRCLGASEARVLDNLIYDCGWQDAHFYYECAGIKLLLTRHCLVANNRIARMTGACGIWLDFDNRESRVSNNVITDIDSSHGGIFIEASLETNRIDHNVIWGVEGPGIFGGDSSRQIYEHNLIGHTTDEGISLFCHTDRQVNKQPVACIDNRVRANLFVEVPRHRADADRNTFGDNVYLHQGKAHQENWNAWQARGFDGDSRFLNGVMRFDPARHTLSWRLDDAAATLGPVGPVALATSHGHTGLAPSWLADRHV